MFNNKHDFFNHLLHHVQQLLGKTNAITLNVPSSFFFPQLYVLSMTSYGMEYPFGQLGSAVPAVSPPIFL